MERGPEGSPSWFLLAAGCYSGVHRQDWSFGSFQLQAELNSLLSGDQSLFFMIVKLINTSNVTNAQIQSLNMFDLDSP